MKKIFIPISALLVTGFVRAQLTPTENYVYSKTYLSDPSLPNVKTAETVQYFDGLGRPKQVVNVKASPLGKDIVTHIEYDDFGRQVDSWLPTPMSTSNGAIQTGVKTTAATYYGDAKAYSHSILETSPLDRVLSKINPGTDWQSNPVTFNYDANTISDHVVSLKTTTTWLNGATVSSVETTDNLYYNTGQLYKNTVTDEDGNITIEFKNGHDQTVLLRKVLYNTLNVSINAPYADTYYVYNEYDQLAFVIPPNAAFDLDGSGGGDQIPIDILNNLCYQYRYDRRNRLVEKKLPGKGLDPNTGIWYWDSMVYDKADRLIATQDAVMRPSGKWLFTKYDSFGRVIYTGIIPADNRPVLQAITNNYVITESRSASGFTKNGIQIYYTNDLYNQIETVLSVNYYDTYPTGSPAIPAQILGQNILSDDAQNADISTKSLPVASYVKNIEDDNWTKNYTWYDNKGRVVGSYSDNHLGGYTKTESLLDFAGMPQQVVTKHKRLNSDTEKMITENFEYDAQNRLKKHWHQVSGQPQELLSENVYNELSQLSNKKVGNNLQSIDYSYNIRGWMTSINDPTNLGNDLFGYKIKYNQVEGEEMPNNDFPDLKVKPKYNGNIAEVDWKTGTTPGDNLRRYGYVYDRFNRLLAGFYQKDANPTAKEYFEKVEYDLNGNITNLKRSEGVLQGTTAMNIDDLTYQYLGSNRLQSVTDGSNQYSGYPDASGNIISYDANGNMTNHIDKGILNINYNFKNLPRKLTFDQTYIVRDPFLGVDEIRNITTDYQYRADGVKLKKIYSYGTGKNSSEAYKITEYLDGFQYEGSGSSHIATLLKFIPTAEGYYDFENYRYIYNYTDHLGNVRLSYYNNGFNPQVLEENNYYPFGMKHPGYNSLIGNYSYQYKYNGKELQTESGMYDYGARFYMPDIGRWGVVDPLAEKMRRHSPYNYAFDNPVRFIDPDGRQGDDWRNKNGQLIYDPKANDGKGAYTKFATDKDIAYGDGLKNSGNTGAAQFDKLVTSELPTTVEYSEENHPFSMGETHPIKKDGKLVGFEITIYEGSSEAAFKDPDKVLYSDEADNVKKGNLSAFDISISTFGHEIGHANEKNHQLHEKQEKTGIVDPKNNSETMPTAIGEKILKELREIKLNINNHE